MGYYSNSDFDKLITAVVPYLMVVVFVLTLFLITMKLQFKNRGLSFFGELALEIYLLQNIFIVQLKSVIENDFLFYLGVYVCTIILVIGMHWIDQRVIAKIRG